MPSRRKKTRNPGRRNAQNVTVRTPAQAFERTLASRSDRSRLMGKCFVSLSSTSSGFVGFNINPASLGVRPAAYAALFTRWRISRLIVKPLALTTAFSANEVCFIGFLDDSITSSDVPTSGVAILDLRCSASSVATSTSATVAPGPISTYNEYEYRPLRGPPTWYFTTLEGSSSDPRLEVPCSLWFGGPSAAVFTAAFEIDYDLLYEGACDVTSSS